MWFVVGLGNPGPKYAGSKHNVGFEVVNALWREHGEGDWKEKHKALIAKGKIDAHDMMFAKPMTYMNLSGESVGPLLRFFKASLEQLIVVHDELDFEPGVVRIKSGGGAGGHNGIKSIVSHVGDAFARVRIGIGKPPSQGVEHVLSGFHPDDKPLIEDALERAVDAVRAIVREGVPAAMQQFNRRNAGGPASQEQS